MQFMLLSAPGTTGHAGTERAHEHESWFLIRRTEKETVHSPGAHKQSSCSVPG